MPDVERPRAGSHRGLGAVLGVSSCLGAWYGAKWAQIGETGLGTLAFLACVGGGLGWLFWPLFCRDDRDLNAPRLWHAGLFAACVGLVSGAIVAFPMGGVCGTLAGFVGGVGAGWVHGLFPTHVRRSRWIIAAVSGLGVGWAVTAWWLA
jgi:hypothetical protein